MFCSEADLFAHKEALRSKPSPTNWDMLNQVDRENAEKTDHQKNFQYIHWKLEHTFNYNVE
jgi:hypothetical protein